MSSAKTLPRKSPSARPTKLVNLFSSSFDVYIDSPFSEDDSVDPRDLRPGEYGFLGNPFKSGTVNENLEKYEEYFLERVKTDRYFYRAVLSLYGKRLGCLGDPSVSHGKTILKWLHYQRANYEKVFGPLTRKRA